MKNLFLPMALIAAILFSCGENSHSEHQNDAPTDELEALAYTLYTDQSELFVEFKPLIVGVESRFAAHFTRLGEQFKALDEGLITLTLNVNGTSNTIQADNPEVPGIFRLRLTPEMTGKGQLIFDIKTKDYSDQIIIENVEVFKDIETAKEANPEENANSSDITYLKEQAWKVEFANAPAKRLNFHEIIKTGGQVMSSPEDEIVLTAKASGIVVFTGNTPLIGIPVKAGTSLFQIAGGDITSGNLDAAIAKAKANYEKAKADFERASSLIPDKIISQKEYLTAKNNFESAQIELSTISKNYSSSGQAIAAPTDGFIKDVFVSQGQFVEAGEPLATISKVGRVILQANVNQRYFDRLASISSATFKSSNLTNYLDTDSLNGKVLSYGKTTGVNTPFIPIIFQMDNPGQLFPGSMVEICLKSRPIQNALVIPMSSLIEEQGLFYVYIQVEGESFQKREVKLGANDGINVQVLTGIEEGERVVTKGAYQIKLSSASGTLPAHGHEH